MNYKKRIFRILSLIVILMFLFVMGLVSVVEIEYEAVIDNFIEIDFDAKLQGCITKPKAREKGIILSPLSTRFELEGFEKRYKYSSLKLRIYFRKTEGKKKIRPNADLEYELYISGVPHKLDKNKIYCDGAPTIDTVKIPIDALEKPGAGENVVDSSTHDQKHDKKPEQTPPPPQKLTVSIVDFNKVRDLFKEAVLACYDEDGQICKLIHYEEFKDEKITVPAKIRRIEFMNSIIAGEKIPIVEEEINLKVRTQNFISYEGEGEKKISVFYRITHQKELLKVGSGNKIKLSYPECKNIKLEVYKEGYKIYSIEDISLQKEGTFRLNMEKIASPIMELKVTNNNKLKYSGNIIVRGKNHTYFYEIDGNKTESTFRVVDNPIKTNLYPEIKEKIGYDIIKRNASLYEIKAVFELKKYTIKFAFPESRIKDFPSKLNARINPVWPRKTDGKWNIAVRRVSSTHPVLPEEKIPMGEIPSVIIKDYPQFDNISKKLSGNDTINVYPRKPALGVVLVLNSAHVIGKQDVLNRKARELFKIDDKKKYNRMYIGYVHYKDSDFGLIEIKKTGKSIVKVKNVISDPMEKLIGKISTHIKNIFSKVNTSSKGEKFLPDRLWIIINTGTLPIDRTFIKKIPSELSVYFIDIVDFLNLKEVTEKNILEKI